MLARIVVPVMGASLARQEADEEGGTIPLYGDTVTYDVRPTKASWERNDHNSADSVEITIDVSEGGTDPRLFTNGEVYFYCGTCDERTQKFQASEQNLLFIGIVVDIKREMDADKRSVTIVAHDYTTLFIKSKPFPATGYPDYSMTLRQAWEHICDRTGAWDVLTQKITSTVQKLKDRIQFVGCDGDTLLGKAVAARFRKFGKVQSKSDDDAWAVWQRCVGSLGLLSFIFLDRVIVTTALDYYTASDPPKFIADLNVLELREHRDVNALTGKGVALTSFDPESQTSIEAFWPPRQLSAAKNNNKKKRNVAAKKGAPQTAVVKEYDYFPYPECTDPQVLLLCAQRVYEERSRQELTGELMTHEMAIPAMSGKEFDLLLLGSGDRIHVEIDAKVLSALTAIPTETGRIKFLTDRAYDPGLARLMVANIGPLTRLPCEFQVRNVRGSLEFSGDGGSFEIHLAFINRISLVGEATSDGPEGPTSRFREGNEGGWI